ncbi:MAG: BamA/TamA family outer membrane protein [Candidatus Aminicenantes bacterium]|nr:BamA/TamA family outer membrane protein [Candidatus Aminicenantes bacterium]
MRVKTLFFSLLLISFLIPQSAYSYFDESTPFVSRVTVEIDGEPSSGDMEKLISIKQGDSFSVKEINSSIKRIYATELFSDIQVFREGSQDIVLTFLLAKRLFTRKIIFSGSDAIATKGFKEGITALREGSSYSSEKLAAAIEELTMTLNDEGYFHVKIEPTVNKLPGESAVDVLFEIGEFERFRVAGISFTGDLIFSTDDLMNEMDTKSDGEFVPSVLDKDLEVLKERYVSEDYRRVEIKLKDKNFDREAGTVSLNIEVISHEKIEIVVLGADVPLSLLRPIWEIRIFEEWGLAEGEAKIVVYMRQKGYLFSSVSSHIERSPNRIRIVYQVESGAKYKIGAMAFEGLSHFTPAQLKKALLIRSNIPFIGSISGARLYELPREIEFLYKSEGFPDARVNLVFERADKSVRPIFQIEEGKQETIAGITFEGIRSFDREELLAQIRASEGGPYFQPGIQKDIEFLENHYKNNGFRGMQIKARIQPEEENRYSIHFMIDEGKQVWVDRVIITGNKVTKKSTILREVRLKESDLARFDLIRETETRLENLGIFTGVDIEEIPLSPDKENLLISVVEGSLNYASLGIGLETRSQPQTVAVWNNEVRPRGTAEYIRSNIFGIAAQLSLVGQLSLREKRAVFTWEQPYLFSLPLGTYLNGWIEQEERKSFSFDRRGIQIGAIKPILSMKNMDLLTTLGYERTELTTLLVSESTIDRRFFPYSKTSIAETFIWDMRDDPFNPKKGFFLSSVLEWAYPLFKVESDFLKTFTKYQHYVPIDSNLTISGTFRLGLGRGRTPIHERFFAGGSNSFRGTRFDELGPKDRNSGKPVGGSALMLFNFELSFPLLSAFKDLYGTVFYDTGNVWDRRKEVSLATFQNAVGLGLRYRTPLGPIRIELAWYVNSPSEEERILGFITIGNVF